MSEPVSPAPVAPFPRKEGSMLKGCLIGCAVVLGGFVVLVGVVVFAAYNFASGVLEDFTATAPRSFPAVEVAQEQRDLLFGKVDMFANALEGKDAPLETLELSEEEINLLLREYPNGDNGLNWLQVDIVGDALRGEISLPLEDFSLPGRYLNGSGELVVSLDGGQIQVFLNSLEVDGQSLPIQALSMLRGYNLALEANQDLQVRNALERIESITVRDGKLVIQPKP
jgi:hypothetical protein